MSSPAGGSPRMGSRPPSRVGGAGPEREAPARERLFRLGAEREVARFTDGLPGVATPFRVEIWFEPPSGEAPAPPSRSAVRLARSGPRPFLVAVLVPAASGSDSGGRASVGPARLESAIRARAEVVLPLAPCEGESRRECIERGLELARGFLSKRSPRALLAARRLLAGGRSVREGLEAERRFFSAFFRTGEARDGIEAFLQGGAPAFARWIGSGRSMTGRRRVVRRRT